MDELALREKLLTPYKEKVIRAAQTYVELEGRSILAFEELQAACKELQQKKMQVTADLLNEIEVGEY